MLVVHDAGVRTATLGALADGRDATVDADESGDGVSDAVRSFAT